MAIKGTIRGGSGAGRGDNANSASVYRYSAKTRNATPATKEEMKADIAQGKTPQSSKGSKASYTVSNGAFQNPGQGMADVRSTYKQARKSGMSADDARGQALTSYNHAGAGHGPDIKPKTDYSSNPIGK